MNARFRPGLQALATMDNHYPLHPSNLVPEGLAADEIAKHSGLDFTLGEAPALMMDPLNGELISYPNRKMIFREDTREPLSFVSDGYKLVQPEEILGTFDAFANVAGFRIAAAGSVKNGARVWAMAETGDSFTLPGGDTMAGYLYMATACDGTLASTGFFTSIAALCWNLMQAMVRDAREKGLFFKIPHNQDFNLPEIQRMIADGRDGWLRFGEAAGELANRRISDQEAVAYIARVLSGDWDEEKSDEENLDEITNARAIAKVVDLFTNSAAGGHVESRKGTAWGALNAVTEYLDHHRPTRSVENRFASATMGDSFNVKTRAWHEALRLAA